MFKFLVSIGTLISCISISSNLIAAEVTKLKPKKKVAVISEGSSSGLSKGQKICFKNFKDKKVACGKIVKVEENSANVKIAAKRFPKVQIGFITELDGQSGSGSGSKFLTIAGKYYGGLAPFTYNRASYTAPNTNDTSIPTLWNAQDPQGVAIRVFGGEVGLPSYGISVGFKYYDLEKFKAEESYYKDDVSEYVDNSNSASALGFFADYYFIETGAVGNGLRLGAGLDINMSTVTVNVIQKSDDNNNETDIYNISSSLTTISLRLPVNYDINLGTLGINFGVNLLVPVVGTAQLSFETQDGNIQKYGAGDNEAFAQEDFGAILNHTKSGFGVEAALGVYFSF